MLIRQMNVRSISGRFHDPQALLIHKSCGSTNSSILKRHEERIPLTIQHEAIRMEPSNRVHMVHKLWKIHAMSPLDMCLCTARSSSSLSHSTLSEPFQSTLGLHLESIRSYPKLTIRSSPLESIRSSLEPIRSPPSESMLTIRANPRLSGRVCLSDRREQCT